LVVNDVIVFHPASSRAAVHAYARRHGTDWLTVLGKARDYDKHLPVIRLEAEKRDAGLHELTAVIAARDARIRTLEETVRERTDALERADTSLREAWAQARRREAGLHELTAVIAARDARIRELEATVRERSEALERADTSLRDAWAEAERREA